MGTWPGSDLISRSAVVPVAAIMVAIPVLWAFGSDRSYESGGLLMVCNIIFITLISILIALLAGRTFLFTGHPAQLMLCCGMTVWGQSAFVASMGTNVGNYNITIHNLGVCAAAICHVSGALLASRARRLRWSAGATLALCVALSFICVGLIWMATQQSWLPIFFVDGQGGTPARTVVLGLAVALFTLAGTIIWRDHQKGRSAFEHWYALGLILIGVGGAGLMLQRVHGSELGWTSRIAQYLGDIYMLIGVAYAVRATRSWELPVAAALEQTKAALRDREEALRRSTSTLQTISETTTELIFLKDRDCRLVYANRATLEVMGVTPEQAIGIDIDKVIPNPEEREAIFALDRRVMESGRAEQAEEVFTDDAGKTRIFLSTKTPLRDAEGSIVGVIGVSRDITERKQVEQTLRESEQRYRTLFDAMDEGYCIIEVLFDAQDQPVDYRFIEVNGSFERQAGMQNPVGRRMLEFVPSIEPHWLQNYGKVARTGEPVRFSGEYKGLNRWFDVYAFRATGWPARHVAVLFADVTQRKHAEQALEQAREAAEAANNAKDNFLATLSHELRTPLTPVLGVLGLWEQSPQFPAELADDLAMVRRNIDLEARLIDDMLDLTRIARGKLGLNLETLDVQELVKSVIKMYGAEARAKKIELIEELGAQQCFVRADTGRLQQVFWNLLKNAVKFTQEGGMIQVLTRNDDAGHIQIVVKDNGIGISQEMLGRLFRPFEQEGYENIKQYGGLGLGLTISKRLVEAQGGTIDVHSEGKQRGATFTITLPCVESPVEMSGGPASSIHPAEQDGERVDEAAERGMRVLLVEDHLDTAQILAVFLRRSGHEITMAHSLAEAVRVARGRPFDLLLSDVGLPDGTGIDLIRRLREEDGLTLPAIAMTGYGMVEDVNRCLDAGFNDHLTKPVNLATLEESMRRFHGNHLGMSKNAMYLPSDSR